MNILQYRNLRAEMARNGVTITQIAKLLGVRFATVSDKLNGRSRFFCDEAILIKRHFFQDCLLEYLFDDDRQSTA
ncbi:helix-turn-helix domain-containing protein [Paenibacillus sp. P26]|nr:helix-turn-helix domain-containing protein [Paenibacillus sp. P26]UUZ93182.1 helix-turn-helix domain-containing protein [Paenibacillus sp. P25]